MTKSIRERIEELSQLDARYIRASDDELNMAEIRSTLDAIITVMEELHENY